MSARRIVAVLSCLATLLGCVVALSSPAAATASLHWGKSRAVDPLRGGYVSVSCSSRSFCLAGGATGDVREWDGLRWRQQSVLDKNDAGIGRMDCVSATFCAAAVDSREGAYRPATFDGTRWTEDDPVEGAGAGDISCASARMCMLVSNEGQYQRWNGGGWTAPRKLDPSIEFDSARVSCASARRCVAVVGAGEVLRYNGSAWREALGEPIGTLTALQCPSPTSCLGVNYAGQWTRFAHSRWTKRASFGAQVIGLSCPSTRFCVSTDSKGGTFDFRNRRWHPRHKLDPAFPIVDVSCASRSFCAAVSYSGDSIIRAAQRWQRPQASDAAFGPLADISCATRGFCAAVDLSGAQLRFDGSHWSTPKRVPGEAEALQSVSCPTVSFCMAVSDRNYTTRAHGRWSAPTNFGDEFFAVSCASKRFCIASTFNAGLLRYDGAGWHQISTMAVSAVSCAPGAPACLAISDEGDSVVVRRNSTASPQDTGDNSGFFRAVSCSSVSFCAALDGRGRTLEWSRGTWTAPAAASGSGALAALSCTSRTFCVAVGGVRAATFNGSRWTAARRVVHGRESLRSVSCVGRRFCVAVDGNTGSAVVAR